MSRRSSRHPLGRAALPASHTFQGSRLSKRQRLLTAPTGPPLLAGASAFTTAVRGAPCPPACRPDEVPAHHLPPRLTHLAAATHRPVRRAPAAVRRQRPQTRCSPSVAPSNRAPGACRPADPDPCSSARGPPVRRAMRCRMNHAHLCPAPLCSQKLCYIALPLPAHRLLPLLLGCSPGLLRGTCPPSIRPTGPSGGPPFGRAIGCMDFTPFSGHRVPPRQPAASVALSLCALHCHSSSIVDSTRRALCM